jgi:hypothetical protein
MATKLFWLGDNPKLLPELNAELDALFADGYEVKIATNTMIVLYKGAPKLRGEMNVSVGNPDAFLGVVDNLMRESSIGDSFRELPNAGTSFIEWYGVRDIP